MSASDRSAHPRAGHIHRFVRSFDTRIHGSYGGEGAAVLVTVTAIQTLGHGGAVIIGVVLAYGVIASRRRREQ